MGRRLELQSLLEASIGSTNVYFQPPANMLLQKPCIIYSRTHGKTEFANDVPYNHRVGYTLTVIDSDPDSTLPDVVSSLPKCIFDRAYTSDNLYHTVYTIFY